MRALGLDPVHDTRETFRGLVDAMSRPGNVEQVPEPADHAVVATLVDHEVTFDTDDQQLAERLTSQGRYEAAPRTDAQIVHALDIDGWDVRECQRGTLEEPSRGATIVYRVASLHAGPADSLTTVTLQGPGVDGEAVFSVSLPPAELDALGAAQGPFPRGVDAIFATEGRVLAVPRSASMEVH